MESRFTFFPKNLRSKWCGFVRVGVSVACVQSVIQEKVALANVTLLTLSPIETS